MSEETISGVVESKSRKGNSIKVNGEWYSTFKSADLDHVNWKDEVVFNYVQKGEYKNIKGKVRVSGASPAASGGGSKFSNTGVELGHASNLAMRMMEQEAGAHEVGSPAYYKQFAEYTMSMYKVMKTLRAKVDAGEVGVAAEAKEEAPARTEAVTSDDIF